MTSCSMSNEKEASGLASFRHAQRCHGPSQSRCVRHHRPGSHVYRAAVAYISICLRQRGLYQQADRIGCREDCVCCKSAVIQFRSPFNWLQQKRRLDLVCGRWFVAELELNCCTRLKQKGK